MDTMDEKIELVKSMSISNVIEDLEDQLLLTLKGDRETDILVRLIPDDELKFAYVGEVQGLLYHNTAEVAYTVTMKQSQVQDVILDQVSEFDHDTRSLLIIEATRIATESLNCEEVHHARSAVIKYQMLMELVKLLAS